MMLTFAKAEGAHGGHVIGHTKSGKPVYESSHAKYAGARKAWKEGGFEHGGNKMGLSVRDKHKTFTAADHRDAEQLHRQYLNDHMHEGKDQFHRSAALGHALAAVPMEYAAKRAASSDLGKSVAMPSVSLRTGQGAGSRGGRVIGRTASGRPIYANHPAGAAGYTVQDHADAADAHQAMADMTDGDKKKHHTYLSRYHANRASADKSLEHDVIKGGKSGEGSKGGSVIGHTKSGAPIYQHTHAGYKKLKQIQSKPGHRSASGQHAMTKFPNYTSRDHADASEKHLHAYMSSPRSGDGEGHFRAHMAHGAASTMLESDDSDHRTDYAKEREAWVGSRHAEDAKARAHLKVIKSTKGEGSRGGHVVGYRHNGEAIYDTAIIGKTRSGKPVLHEGHPAYKNLVGVFRGHENVKNTHDNAKTVMGEHPDWSRQDHHDAAKLHEAQSVKHFKEGRDGPSDKADSVQLAHRYAASQMPRNVKERAVKSDAPDMVKALNDVAERAAAMVSLPFVTHELNPGGDGGCPIPPKVLEVSGPRTGMAIPLRVDVLAPSPMSAAERLAVAKAIQGMPMGDRTTELSKSGLPFMGPCTVDISKGTLSINEFANAVGTTEDTVRMLAHRCGDKDHFVAMIRDKMPDIQRAHGLSTADSEKLYASAVRTVKSLSDEQFSRWMSKSFNGQAPSDQGIAEAIRVNGFMNPNMSGPGGFALHGGPVHRQTGALPCRPEPVAAPLEMRPVVDLNALSQ